MSKKRVYRSIWFWVFVVVICIVTVLFSIGPARKWLAEKKALQFAKETGINTSYAVSSDAGTLEETMRALYKIAVWAKDTYKDIDEAFGLKYDWETYQERKEPGSFAPKEELDEASMESSWMLMRNEVWDSTESVAEILLEHFSDQTPLHADSFSTCCFYDEAKRII